MNWSIRARLTLWNAVVNASIIIVLGAIVYFALAKALLEGVDSVLAFEYRETVERLEKLGSDDELGTVPAAFLEEFLLRVSDPSGRIRMESPSLEGVTWQPPVTESTGREPVVVTTVVGSSGEQRMIFGRAGGSHAGWTVQIATSLADYRREMNQLRNIFMILFPISLLIASVAGYGLAGRALAPVKKITRTAQRISGANLSERIKSDRSDDELGRLAGTLNSMVERLAESLEAMRRFTADASHEFMTPLAQIRTEIEVALQTERTAEEYSHVLRSVVEEVERLTRLALQLLALAKEDALAADLQPEDCPLEPIVRSAVSAHAASASEAGVTLSLGVVEPVTLSIDPDRLRQVLDNLLQNAIRYNRPGGRVDVNLQASDHQVTISVIDTGVGIPVEALPHVFDRFYRVDLARSRRAGGTGLGLSIANTFIKKMRGRIDVESVVGDGSTFRVVLPTGMQ